MTLNDALYHRRIRGTLIDFMGDRPMILGNHHDTTPEAVIITFAFGLPESVPKASMALTTSIPSTTSPNTTCRPSSHDVTAVVMKN
jgi:hypothetical protein